MSSVVQICNLALSRLGDEATVGSIDPPEGSAQASHCAQFYPVARDSMLEMHAWSFATRREALAELDADTFDWAHDYALPAGCLRVLQILPASGGALSAGLYAQDAMQHEVIADAEGAPMVLSNIPDAIIVYTKQVVDTQRFTPLFTDALAWLLASYLAGVVVKGSDSINVAKAMNQMFAGVYAQAVSADANKSRVHPAHAAPWMAGRNVSGFAR